MSVTGIEMDIERALRLSIVARLATDAITGVKVATWTGAELTDAPGSDRNTVELPYVHVMCMPVVVLKPGAQWETSVTVTCRTGHTTGNDRSAKDLATIARSVAACLDYSNLSSSTQRIYSLITIRSGGDHNLDTSINETTITATVRACGTK